MCDKPRFVDIIGTIKALADSILGTCCLTSVERDGVSIYRKDDSLIISFDECMVVLYEGDVESTCSFVTTVSTRFGSFCVSYDTQECANIPQLRHMIESLMNWVGELSSHCYIGDADA